MLDHIKREIVRPAETPNHERQQEGRLHAEILCEEKPSRCDADHQEQKRLQVNRRFAL
jgi:hypothetical protein